MDMLEMKRKLTSQVSWADTFPRFPFIEHGYRSVYFFETPLLTRGDLGLYLGRVLHDTFPGTSIVSAGHERDGGFDEKLACATTWNSDGAAVFVGSESEIFRREHAPTWSGLVLAAHERGEWMLLDDPREPLGVLVTRDPLSRLDDDAYILTIDQILEPAAINAFGFTSEAVKVLRATYGSGLPNRTPS